MLPLRELVLLSLGSAGPVIAHHLGGGMGTGGRTWAHVAGPVVFAANEPENWDSAGSLCLPQYRGTPSLTRDSVTL